MKKDLGVTSEQDQNLDTWFDEKEKRLCVGSEKFDLKFGNINLTLADFVDRFEINKSIWPAIDVIKKRYRIGLLTNMYPGMYPAILKRGIIPDIDWDVVIDSSIVKLAKPDPAIYKLAEDKSGAIGQEILFVENTLENIIATRRFGWETFLYDSANPEMSSHKLLEICFNSS